MKIKFNEPKDGEITGTIETGAGSSNFRVFECFGRIIFHQSGCTQEAMYSALPAIEVIQNNFQSYYNMLSELFSAK